MRAKVLLSEQREALTRRGMPTDRGPGMHEAHVVRSLYSWVVQHPLSTGGVSSG